MKTVRCSFNNIHQNRKNLPRNKDDAYAHEVTERSAVPERSEVVWFSSNEVWFKGVRARPVGGAGAHAPEEVHLGVRIFFWTILVVLTLSLSFLCILQDSCRPR